MYWLTRLFRNMIGDRWVVARCCWPFPPGYCCYNAWREMSLDHGASREQAQQICDTLNRSQ